MQKRCLRTKLLVTVYSKHLQQISVHVSTDIHRSWTQGGKSSPFTRHPIRSKTIRQGEKKIKCQGRKPGGCRAQTPSWLCWGQSQSHCPAPFWLSYDDAGIRPWEDSGLHVHSLAHPIHVPQKKLNLPKGHDTIWILKSCIFLSCVYDEGAQVE